LAFSTSLFHPFVSSQLLTVLHLEH
jgi:hypothetical protein